MTNLKTLKEFEDHLLADNASKETIKSYIRTIEQLLDFLKKSPDDVTEKDLERFKLFSVKIKQYDSNQPIINQSIKWIRF